MNTIPETNAVRWLYDQNTEYSHICVHIYIYVHIYTYQGMSRPIFVHLLLLIKKPATGSVTAPEALPMNSTKEAWNGVIWKYRQNTVNRSHCFTIQWNSIKWLSRKKHLSVLKNNDSSFTKHVCCCHRNSYWLPIVNKWDIEIGAVN